VHDDCVFVDDGISGAEFDRRPGFRRLMGRLARPSFQVLIMAEESRLGRESGQTFDAFGKIVRSGVRVFLYLEDRELTLGTFSDNTMTFLRAEFAAEERRKAAQRTADAMERKARAGHVTGGRVFGYDNVDVVDSTGKRSHVDRRINEPEAAIVRRIFTLAADGVGQKRIAHQLNADGAIAPRAQRDRVVAWATSSVHEVLFRELYRGEIVWNRTRKRDRWGQKRQTPRPPAEWTRTSRPDLRIVDETLWQAAHTRIAEARALYRDATKGLRGGRPKIESRYLLTGLAQCTCCGGGLHVRTGNHGTATNRWRVYSYACSSYYNRGPAICPNKQQTRMEVTDRSVLNAIGELMTPDLVDDIIVRARQLAEPDHVNDYRERVARELEAAEQRVTRLCEAIELGAGDVRALVLRLQEAEQRRQELATRANAIADGPLASRVDWRAVERQGRRRLHEWRGLLGREPIEGRGVLKQLLASPIRFTPFSEAGKRKYRFAGELVIAGWLLEGVVNHPGNWRPHRDSNPGFSLERAAS
jgi:site-specific DNA recombinase